MTKHINRQINVISTASKVFFVGDIHGQVRLLTKALSNAGFRPEDGHIVISVGDLIDGGDENELALELLNESWFRAVMGNHELLMIDALEDIDAEQIKTIHTHLFINNGLQTLNDFGYNRFGILTAEQYIWIRNGGYWFFDSIDDRVIAYRLALLGDLIQAKLPVGIEVTSPTGIFGAVHAELPISQWHSFKKNVIEMENIRDVLWSRRKIQLYKHTLIKDGLHIPDITALLVGHTIIKGKAPMTLGNTVFLDSGAKTGNAPTVISDAEVIKVATINNGAAA